MAASALPASGVVPVTTREVLNLLNSVNTAVVPGRAGRFDVLLDAGRASSASGVFGDCQPAGDHGDGVHVRPNASGAGYRTQTAGTQGRRHPWLPYRFETHPHRTGDPSLTLPDRLRVTSIKVIRSQVRALDGHQVELVGLLRGIPGQETGLLVAESDKGKVYFGGGDPNLGQDLASARAETTDDSREHHQGRRTRLHSQTAPSRSRP